MSNQKIIIACALTAVVSGVVGYVGGVKMSSLRRFSQFNNRSGNQMVDFRNGDSAQDSGKATRPAPNMMIKGGAVMGEVTTKDDSSITVKMNDGSSRIVILSDTTTYRTSSESNLANVNVGTKVAVFGNSNSDGSTTANNIEINPVMLGQEFRQ